MSQRTQPEVPAESAPRKRRLKSLFLLPIAVSAFVATWGGWIGLAEMIDFGKVDLMGGMTAVPVTVSLALTLPLGVEAYAAYAMSVWLGHGHTEQARRFAMFSSISSLILAAAGQIAYHVLHSRQTDSAAPDWLVAGVATLPVIVLGASAALHHLSQQETSEDVRPVRKTSPARSMLGALSQAATEAAVRRLSTPRLTVSETGVSGGLTVSETRHPVNVSRPASLSHRTVSPGQPQGVDLLSPEDEARLSQVRELRATTPPTPYRTIATQVGVSPATAQRLGKLAELRDATRGPIADLRPTEVIPDLVGAPA